ncbi:uncharacterized protein H6S33_003846 [Morchella sextelata]|uniref:uncharacterized protein n=1 Tax=Morchella sextelata TaxID=1174677 RepID=UPI001D03F569|nr:uncharacterized protein H6S33_003846 [Morchella sextelata]KAH0606185.1 hypothetical protein H6S33_003846 [Morchella sextelata]
MSKSSSPEDQPPVHQIPTLVTSYIHDNSDEFEVANVVIGIATVIIALLALSKTWRFWKGWKNWRRRNRTGIQNIDSENPATIPLNHQEIYYDFSNNVHILYNRNAEQIVYREPEEIQGMRGLLWT